METMEDKALRKLFAGGKRYYVRRSTLEEVIEKMTRLRVELEQGNLRVCHLGFMGTFYPRFIFVSTNPILLPIYPYQLITSCLAVFYAKVEHLFGINLNSLKSAKNRPPDFACERFFKAWLRVSTLRFCQKIKKWAKCYLDPIFYS